MYLSFIIKYIRQCYKATPQIKPDEKGLWN